jgi:hypothetical protein
MRVTANARRGYWPKATHPFPTEENTMPSNPESGFSKSGASAEVPGLEKVIENIPQLPNTVKQFEEVRRRAAVEQVEKGGQR